MPDLQLPGICIHYEEEGSGLPLVWLPGGNDSAFLMMHVHRRLAQRVRLICVDPRGQGESDSRTMPEDYSPAGYVSDVLGVLDALGLERVVLGGHSRGGRTSVEVALTYPERVIGVIAAASPLLGFTPERGDLFDAYQGTLANQGVDAFLELLRSAPRHPERLARWRAAAHHAGPDALIAQYDALKRLQPLTPRLPGLQVPALLMSGDRDHLLTHSQACATATPNARLVVVKNAGHALFADNPNEYFTALSEFLDAVQT